MLIVADQNIPRVEEAFGTLGEVRPVDGRTLERSQLGRADVVLVRSVTPVNESLLAGTPVKFVGSATSGVDHVDRGYLAARSIEFAWSPGVNARAVAEYVISAMLTLADRRSDVLDGKTLGIVGYGHVGRRLARLAGVLGLQCMINDPPLADTGAGPAGTEYHSLAELAARADIVSLHLPLNIDGPYRSRHLVDGSFLSTMRDGAWLINTARGAVVDTAALNETLASGRLRAVLDVWEGEPAIAADLLRRVALGTPHIAGYSAEGKYNATSLLYRAVCRYFERTPVWENHLPGGTTPVDLRAVSADRAVAHTIQQACDVSADDARLRQMLDLPAGERAAYFDRLRAGYPVRREFPAWSCIPPGDARTRHILQALGFDVVPES